MLKVYRNQNILPQTPSWKYLMYNCENGEFFWRHLKSLDRGTHQTEVKIELTGGELIVKTWIDCMGEGQGKT